MLVSVLMCIYKEEVPVVSNAIESIRNQTYKDIEIIVLLDNPQYDEMQLYLKRLSLEEERMKYIVNPVNMGLIGSLNKGIHLCNGTIICRMDADDYAEPLRIEKQLEHMRSHSLDLVGSYISLMDMQGNMLGEIRLFPTQHKYLCRYLKYASAIPHPTWLIKKEVYEALQGYRHIQHAEDYDFLIRLCIHRYKMGVVPEPLLRYRINLKGTTQQNIASQKIVSSYLAQQLQYNRIYSEEKIAGYRKKKQKRQDNLTRYYAIMKKLKAGDRVMLKEWCIVIFSRQNLSEIKQRVTCRWILSKDNSGRKKKDSDLVQSNEQI